MIDWKRKFASRKFWTSIASFVSMMAVYFGAAESEGAKIAALIMAGATVIGYTIGEGLADSSTTINETQIENQEGARDDGAGKSN